MEEAEYLCERIVILDKGKILAQGTLSEILTANNFHEIIEFSFNEKDVNIDFIRNSGLGRVDLDDKTLKFKLFVSGIVAKLPSFLSLVQLKGYSMKSLECHKMTLDDLFIEMTGRRLDQ